MLLSKTKSLISKALAYNVAEAALAYYMETDTELDDIAGDISSNALDFEEGYIPLQFRECKTASEALHLPEKIAVAIQRCYDELPYIEAEEAIRWAVNTLKGQAILNIL